jgi:hypothetical protein
MDRIVCEWCNEENEPNRTDCKKCGAPLHVKDRVGDPFEQYMTASPPPFETGSPVVAPPLPAFRPPRRKGGVLPRVAFVIIVMVVGIAVLNYYNLHKRASTHRSSASTTSKPALQLQTADGLNGLLTDIRNHFGDTMGYELIVYPDSALIKRADPNNNRHEKSYMYAKHAWSDWDTSSMSVDAAVADLSKFDVAAVTAKVPGAPQSLGMTDFKQISLNVEGLADGSLKLYIWLSDAVDIATMDINPDGSVKALHPPH